MSSRYVKLYSSLWSDDRYRTLGQPAQWAFMMLVSQPDLSHAGVLALTTKRWATLAEGLTPHDVSSALGQLQAAGFVATDEGTEELWVRGYMKHDGQHTNPNGLKAVRRAIDAIVSQTLRDLATSALDNLPRPATRAERPTQDQASTDDLPQAACDAIALLAEFRLTNAGHVRSRKRYIEQLTASAATEHGAALSQAVASDPNITAQRLATTVLGVPEADAITAEWNSRNGQSR